MDFWLELAKDHYIMTLFAVSILVLLCGLGTAELIKTILRWRHPQCEVAKLIETINLFEHKLEEVRHDIKDLANNGKATTESTTKAVESLNNMMAWMQGLLAKALDNKVK